MPDVTVKTEDVVKEYQMGDNIVRALAGISLEINRGEYISVMGPSGSGKTTLFNMIGALDKPTAGTVFIDEQNTSELRESQIAWLRCHKIGYIFQTFNLLPVMTAQENVALPMIFAGLSSSERMEKSADLLTSVGLGERLDHKPEELSGGQRQRVAIARALANGPSIILADEPTGNLDVKTGREIIALLKEMNETNNVTVITNTHDLKMIDVSDRIVYIVDGAIDRIRTREEVNLRVGKVSGDEFRMKET